MTLAIRHERKRLPWVRIIIVTGLLGVMGVSSWHLYRWYTYGDNLPISIPAFTTADTRVDESEVTKQQVDDHMVEPEEPRYLSIPSLGIEKARVFDGGVESGGMLQAPANLSDVTWYRESAVPGSDGVVLMNGHNGGVTRNGVFAKLNTLSEGATITLERGDGRIFQYAVRSNESMALEDVNKTGMKMMTESAIKGEEALNIITCDGKWVPRFQQYDRRIMLRATIVDSAT